MSRLGGSRGCLRLATLSSALLAAETTIAAGEPPPSAGRENLASNVRISDPARAAAGRKAVLGAFDSLGSPKCQQIFSDLRDASGQTLQEKLDSLGKTGQSYLGLVLFYEGSTLPGCRSSVSQDISAVTTPGSRVIFICRSNFSRGRRPKPFYPEAVILHEMLHSLGLGENPPTSDEITWRVFSRCG